MEPAAVLVGPFHIDIGNAVSAAIRAVAQHESVGRATVEPHIQNVRDLGVIVRIDDPCQEPRLCAFLIPRICALGLKCLGDARIDRVVAQQKIRICRQRAHFDKAGQRHAPRTLA